jgi:hypothetical protein
VPPASAERAETRKGVARSGTRQSGCRTVCWLDLAATTLTAQRCLPDLFGWTSHEQLANGGSFTRLRLSDHDVGSIYQLKRPLITE